MSRELLPNRHGGQRALACALLLSGWACGRPAPEPTGEAAEAQAARLAQEILIVDTHIDVPYRLAKKPADISQRTEEGDFDYVRARRGGLNAPFLSIYVPASFQQSGGARAEADRLLDLIESLAQRWPDRFAIATSPEAVRRQAERGLMSLAVGMENGAPIEEDLANLDHFYRRGVRYITLVHSKNNQIADSSYDEEPTWNGLSPFGRQAVEEMNRVGMMIDISHITDQAFFQVLELSRAPVIASHSSCRRFTPGWERNLSDEMIRALAEHGGVIHINFGSAFLTEKAYQASQEMWDRMDDFIEEHGLSEDDPRVDAFRDQYRKEHPPVLADVADVADHIDHVVGLVGVEHVGVGSDFEGVGPTTPTGLKDVSYYPNLIRVLLARGYSEDYIRLIFGGNTLRVWEEVEKTASQLQSESPRGAR